MVAFFVFDLVIHMFFVVFINTVVHIWVGLIGVVVLLQHICIVIDGICSSCSGGKIYKFRISFQTYERQVTAKVFYLDQDLMSYCWVANYWEALNYRKLLIAMSMVGIDKLDYRNDAYLVAIVDRRCTVHERFPSLDFVRVDGNRVKRIWWRPLVLKPLWFPTWFQHCFDLQFKTKGF